ncbi:MAG: PAS domain-containing protein [Desulfomonile sp.]|nr:PAS domain-containing protein [Desulfomonile sp.]
MVLKTQQADIPKFSPNWDTSTQTIDFDSLFNTDLSVTGTFDLRTIQSTALGKLLDAVPIPALLVTEQCRVIFANKACDKLAGDDSQIMGSLFLDFLPRVEDDERSRVLANKAEAIFRNALETRKPQKAEAILRIGSATKWFRLHLRCVRMVERHILVILEDLTHEKVRLRVNAREEHRLRKTVEALRRRVQELTAELAATREDLKSAAIAGEAGGGSPPYSLSMR